MKRTGTTLIEVLAAIFILALGLVALMTLFPLGAAQMARAIQDERAAQLAANSAAYFRWTWKNLCEMESQSVHRRGMMFEPSSDNGTSSLRFDWVQPTPSSPNIPARDMSTWFTAAMDDPNSGAGSYQRSAPGFFPAITQPFSPQYIATMRDRARSAGPSYPVLVDPVGWYAAGNTADRYWVSPSAPPGIGFALPRRTVLEDPRFWPSRADAVMKTQNVLRSFFLLDDMGFDSSGIANSLERVGQYSAAWLLRRDKNHKRNETNLTVVVYFKRSIETLSPESSFLATPTAAALPDGSVAFGTALTLHYTGDRPALRRGSWILDATMSATDPQGFYYRVTDVGEPTPNGSEFSIDVQLETPIRRGPLGAKSRVFLVQDRVLEVFDKGPIEMNSPARAN